jgi:hypothetical protein
MEIKNRRSLVHAVGRPNSFYAPFGCVLDANCISWIRCRSSGSCKIPCRRQPHSSSLLLFTVLSPLPSTHPLALMAISSSRSRTDEEDTLQSHLGNTPYCAAVENGCEGVSKHC